MCGEIRVLGIEAFEVRRKRPALEMTGVDELIGIEALVREASESAVHAILRPDGDLGNLGRVDQPLE